MRTSGSVASATAEPEEQGARLHGMTLARWGCALVFVAVVGLEFAGIPDTYAQLTTLHQPSSEAAAAGALTPAQVASLASAGISLSQYAILYLLVNALTELVFFAVAFSLFWRRPNNRMALFASGALVVFGGTFGSVPGDGMMGALVLHRPSLAIIVTPIVLLGDVSFPILFYLFPSGRWVPHWTRWLVIPWVVCEGAQDLLPNSALSQRTPVGSLLFLGLVSTVVIAQIYRFRHVSTPIERQQTKWVVFGIGIGVGGFLSLITIGSLLAPDLTTWHPLTLLMANIAVNLCVTLVPVSIGIAILRSRLFDIDVIFNRALVYGALTVTLAAVYFGSVVALQQIVRLLSGQQSQPAWIVVLSTLVIAALFQPLRRSLQSTIDRRFYRSRYDAARTLGRFAASLRSEVDLAQLNAHLLSAVYDTMRPTHVSLWLRSHDPHGPQRRDEGLPERL